jgi:hypothetical protein
VARDFSPTTAAPAPLPTRISPDRADPHDAARPCDEPNPRAAAGLPDVSGYAVRRVLGRGGMGVVYRAITPAGISD